MSDSRAVPAPLPGASIEIFTGAEFCRRQALPGRLRGDLGPSYRNPDHDVNYFVWNSLPKSMLIGVLALGISVVVGIGVGMISAMRQNSWADYSAMSFAVIGITYYLYRKGKGRGPRAPPEAIAAATLPVEGAGCRIPRHRGHAPGGPLRASCATWQAAPV